jgi:predicted RND superfamily exporter protein
MSNAIRKTFTSVLGSSLTTIAGFLALCSMNLSLGKDIGIVMAKGVLFGVISVVTILPALILECDKIIEKTKHKEILPKFTHLRDFIIKHYVIITILFIIILPIAFYGYKNTDVYYKLDKSLPESLSSVEANNTLKEDFNMASMEMLLINKDIPEYKTNEMIEKIENMEGIEWAIGYSKLGSIGIPKAALPQDLIDVFQSDKYQMILINSKYEIATDELNTQVKELTNLVKGYDENAILAGEGPLMKDLVEIADHDFNSVNTTSIAVIFVIMLFVLKSFFLPVILISVIEFAIFINMGIPYYTNVTVPFVASIVIGTIQLGATIDYAILITNKYIVARKDGKNKKEAAKESLGTSIGSIVVSGLCFFGATFGVGAYSKIEMIGSLCTLMSRGAIISMLTVICVLPAFLMIFDKIICKTTIGIKEIN